MLYAASIPKWVLDTWSEIKLLAFGAIGGLIAIAIYDYVRGRQAQWHAAFRLYSEQQQGLEIYEHQLRAKPKPDMTVPQIVEYFIGTLKYETILDIECELGQAAADDNLKVWAMDDKSPLYKPVHSQTFRQEYIFIFRPDALAEVIKMHGTCGLTEEIIRTGGLIVHAGSSAIAYATPMFSESQIKSIRWSDRRSVKPPASDTSEHPS